MTVARRPDGCRLRWPQLVPGQHPAEVTPPFESPNACTAYVAGLIVDFYQADPRNGCGGLLHILLDDDNVEDHWLPGLALDALHQPDAAAVVLCWWLGWLSPTQRLRASKLSVDAGRYRA